MKTDFHAILRGEARELSRDRIDAMSWDDARTYYYLNKDKWKAAKPKDQRTRVCFTGFTTSEKDILISIAKQKGMKVCSRVTLDLNLLVCGPNAGPAKLQKAAEQGVAIISEDDFGAI